MTHFHLEVPLVYSVMCTICDLLHPLYPLHVTCKISISVCFCE